jgi:catechol 2,3-dioxygenase-like lactoylglutathione lyase family enzyme
MSRAYKWRKAGVARLRRTWVRFAMLPLVICVGAAGADNLPITRLGGAAFSVADMEKSRQFYHGVLALPEVVASKDRAVYQINENQFVEFSGGAGESFKLRYIWMLTPDPDRLARILQSRGVAVKKGDGYISIEDPEHNEIRFVRPRARPKAAGGFSDHLLHVGVNSDHEPESMALYRDKLNFRELQRGGPSPAEIRWIMLNMPGTPGDSVEVMIAKAQPPAARQHICFEVADTQRTYKDLTARGLPERNKPFPAQNHRMIMNLRDPNGLRVEIMGEPTK